jgi:hypothetical protein
MVTDMPPGREKVLVDPLVSGKLFQLNHQISFLAVPVPRSANWAFSLEVKRRKNMGRNR